MTALPRRLVSLAASNTEIVCALGLAERLVGLDDFSDFPPEVQHLPRVGRDLEINAARVAALEPDLVLASLSVPGMERNLPALEAAGLSYLAIQPRGWQGLWDTIREIGAACDRAAAAERLVTSLQARVAAVSDRLANVDYRPSVYWEWWPRPPIAPGGPSWITTMLELAGGQSCTADLPAESQPVELNDVLTRQPDAIVLCWCGAHKLADPAQVARRPGWGALPAVKAGRVYPLLEPCFGRPGPRLVDGLEQLARLLHPERFP